MTSPSGDRLSQKPLGVRAARLALLFVAIVNLAGAAFRTYQAVTVVRPDRLLEFTWKFIAYPAALAVLAGLAIWMLYRERPAGAALASLILAVHGVRLLIDAALGEGDYPNATSRLAGQLFTGAFAVLFIWCARSLGVEARSLHRRQGTATVST